MREYIPRDYSNCPDCKKPTTFEKDYYTNPGSGNTDLVCRVCKAKKAKWKRDEKSRIRRLEWEAEYSTAREAQ